MQIFGIGGAFLTLDNLSIFLGLGATLLLTGALILLGRFVKLGHDRSDGVQKFHVRPTSRMGGLAIAFGLAVSGASLYLRDGTDGGASYHVFWFLLAAIPVWLAGLIEDLTHRVGPSIRLVMATVSAAWLFSALGFGVFRTDVWIVDLVLSIPGAPMCATLLVVAGFTHSANIVDGFHGLAGGLMTITLASLAFMAWTVGDLVVMQMSLMSCSVVVGFLVFNWPRGLIFLGDAGAYLIGFWVVELGVLLAHRNPDISPMAPVVAGLLPLIETLFSMYRRKLLRDLPVNDADAVHLHTLVYRRLLFNPAAALEPHERNKLNSCVALYFWAPAAVFSVLSCVFLRDTIAQLCLMLGYLSMYLWLYRRLVHFKSPKFMNFRQ